MVLRHQIEDISKAIFSIELITKLCATQEKPELTQECLDAKAQAIADSVTRGNPADDIKSASNQIFTEIKRILGLTQCGNNKCAFVRDTMTPLVTEDTTIYQELENEIFD